MPVAAFDRHCVLSGCVIAAFLCGAGMQPARAAESSSGVCYVAVSVESDDADSTNLAGEFGLPLGDRGWLHLGLGSSAATLDSRQLDTTVASISAGLDSEHFAFDAGYAWRQDSDSFEQHDLRGAFTLIMSRGSLGLDLFHRSAADETLTSIERRRREPLAIRIVESIEGSGFGVHGDIKVSEQMQLFAAAMKYDYDTDVDAPAFLTRFPRLNLRVSGVTREEAFLDNTVRAGMTYRFSAASLTARYIRDEEIGTRELTGTFELSADIPVGDQWTLAPWVGQSANDSDGDIVFAGLQISVLW